MECSNWILVEALLFLFLTLETSTLERSCDCSRDSDSIICSGLSTNSSKPFKICDLNPSPINASQIQKLSIQDSKDLEILELEVQFGSDLDSVREVLIVNNSRLRRIQFCRSESCDWVFSNLESLDLRNNCLSDSLSPTSVLSLPALKAVYLSGNPWSCFSKNVDPIAHKLSWLLPGFEKDIIQDEPKCSKPKSDKWHQARSGLGSTSSNVTLHYFLEFYQSLRARCPKDCKCLTININEPLLVKVSCIRLNLTTLPKALPPNTVDLDISYNKLTSLVELRTNPDYQNLSQLRAVQNQVSSLSDLRGSPFMSNKPTAINLRKNSIKFFDIKLLSPLLSDMRSKNFHGSVDFFFSENPLDCDCKYLTNLQQFLYEYKLYLRDADLLACGESQSPILIQIDYVQFCETSIDYMWIVIAGEVTLLILVLSRLTYDVINYRRSGELPWLAKHMYMGCSYSGLRKSTLPTFLRHSECRSNCQRDNASLHEENLRIQGNSEDNELEDSLSKSSSKVFVLREVFRPKRSSSISIKSPVRGEPETCI